MLRQFGKIASSRNASIMRMATSTTPATSCKAFLSTKTCFADIAGVTETKPLSVEGQWNPQLTKIVATIGPTSEQLPVMSDLVKAGFRIMRLNFSHATTEEVELRVSNLKKCIGRHGASSMDMPEDLPGSASQMANELNVRAVLLDTRGPEIRMGKLRDDFSGKKYGVEGH